MAPIIEPRRSPAVQHFGKTYGVPSAALLAACQRALTARAQTDTVRPLILAMQAQVLSEQDFQMDRRWVEMGLRGGRISDPNGAYEMAEKRFEEYYAACAAKYRAAGYQFPDQQCPLAIAEHAQAQAEVAFGLACKELRTGIDPEKALEYDDNWKRFLALVLAVVVPFLTPYESPEPAIEGPQLMRNPGGFSSTAAL